MTSSKPSDGTPPPVQTVSATADGVCDQCGGPMRLRNAKPYPVALQVAFGVSFVAFLWAQSTNFITGKALWGWSVIQVILGVLLVRARYASAKKVFICLRCGATLR